MPNQIKPVNQALLLLDAPMRMELDDSDKVRLLRFDGGRAFRSPHRLQRRCICVSSRTKRRLKVVFGAAFFISAAVALVMVLPIKDILLGISSWIDLHPAWGALLLPIMFCVAIPLAIPATMLEILSGSVFGVTQGALLNAVGKTCGSMVAFLIGKRLGKERLGSYLQTKFPLFTALSSVVEGPNWRPLLLLQLSSIPPVVKCYGLSITDISVFRFAVTSMLGGFPNATLWAYIGCQTRDFVSGGGGAGSPSDKTKGGAAGSTGEGRWVMMAIGLVCTVLAMGVLFVYTRRELQAQILSANKKEKRKMSNGGDDKDECDETSALMEDCEVVMTQMAILDTPQHVAKRLSVV